MGLIAPDFAVELKPIGTGFVNLIKMMISPIIFCTIVLGIGSVRKAAKVGAVGGIALGYFVVMSLVALTIGLVVGNILDPGTGLAVTDAIKDAGQGAGRRGGQGHRSSSCSAIIPTTIVSAFTEGEVLQTLLVALLAGFALQAMGSAGAADPARCRAHPAARLPHPRHGDVGGARSVPSAPWRRSPARPVWTPSRASPS